MTEAWLGPLGNVNSQKGGTSGWLIQVVSRGWHLLRDNWCDGSGCLFQLFFEFRDFKLKLYDGGPHRVALFSF